MFRSMKKKKKLAVGQTTRRSTVRRSSLLDDNDDNDDDEHQNEKNEKRNENNNGPGVVDSVCVPKRDREEKFINDEDTNDEEESSSAQLYSALQNHKNKKHSKKKKRILGKRKTKGVVSLGLSFVLDDDDDNDDDHDNDDDEGDQDLKKDKKKNKKKKKHNKKRKKGLGFGGGGGGFGADEDDARRDTAKNADEQQTDEVNNYETIDSKNKDDDDDDDGLQPPSYGKEALGRLKSEQQRQKIIRMPLMSPPSPSPPLSAGVDLLLSTDDNIGVSNNNNKEKKNSSIPSESFISLNDLTSNNSDNHQIEGMVLTGEDADHSYDIYHFQKEKQDDNKNKNENKKKVFLTDRYSSSPLPKNNEGTTSESAAWEARIEQRAFGSKSSASSSSPSKKNNNKVASLDELSTKLKSTLDMIQTQRTELENSTNRRKVDYEQTLVELKLQQTTLQTTGVACEYYQKIRRELTMWVGALRELQTKISPILQAYLEMYQIQKNDFHSEFLSWQNDCVSLLHEQNRIDIVLGRQQSSSQSPSTANGAMIDEFGRDIRSQYLRDRDIRFKKRNTKMKNCLVSTTDDTHLTSVDDTVDDEIGRKLFCDGDGDGHEGYYNHNEKERSETLQEAMTVALQDLNHKYTSIVELRQVFDHWIDKYNDDYNKCFATLSFGDLYAVLIQLEICQSTFFSDLLLVSSTKKIKCNSNSNNNSNNLPPFPAELHCLLKNNQQQQQQQQQGLVTKKTILSTTEKENQGRFVRAVEKGILPLMTEIFLKVENKNSSHFGLFYSSTKSALLSQLLEVAIPQLRSGQQKNSSSVSSTMSSSTCSDTTDEKIQQLISTAIANCLDGIAIPILKKNSGIFKSEEDGNNRNENNTTTDVDVATEVSIRFTSVYLVQILQRTLCNIILYWLPLLPLPAVDSDSSSSTTTSKGENGIHVVFNFINDNYLQLLSSVGGDGNNNNESPSSSLSAKTLLVPVWDAIHRDERNIINSASLVLVTMPLRAAAHAYQLN